MQEQLFLGNTHSLGGVLIISRIITLSLIITLAIVLIGAVVLFILIRNARVVDNENELYRDAYEAMYALLRFYKNNPRMEKEVNKAIDGLTRMEVLSQIP